MYGVMMTQALVRSKTVSFNALALRYQDEAYTLAFYLLGQDALAAEATQAAFARVYQLRNLPADRFHLDILRAVLAGAQELPAVGRSFTAADDLMRRLLALPFDERSALALVDVLGLGYDLAADVLGWSQKSLAGCLGRARLGLSQPDSSRGD